MAKPKTIAKVATKPVVEKKVATKKTVLSVPVYSLKGKTSGTLSLPKEIFGTKVNEKLLAQAIRVYSTNRKFKLGSTKGRGDVEGSTAKIFRQKGTGRARHGAIRAPIFVGGGIAFGPTPRKTRLTLPKNMKNAALISALSAKAASNQIAGFTGLEKATGKTKEMFEALKKVNNGKTALIVTGQKQDNIVRSTRNIPGVNSLSVNLINAYEVLKYETLLITKDALDKLVNPNLKEKK